MSGPNESFESNLPTAQIKFEAQRFRTSIEGNYARRWFEFSLNEARNHRDANGRMREIIFAVCFSESYLFEWVRDDVLKYGREELKKYFPITNNSPSKGNWKGCLKALLCKRPTPTKAATKLSSSPKEKWKRVLEQFRCDKSIQNQFGFGEKFWQDYTTLLEYRNGLIHASASRPYDSDAPEKEHPKPRPNQLTSPTEPNPILSGWPTEVVRKLVIELHSWAGTAPPVWLEEP